MDLNRFNLILFLNPGPGLVEPSVSNTGDPNISTLWGFFELTYNDYQLYANISYVDFVSIPIALSLTNTSGATQVAKGLPRNGLELICQGLRDQTSSDGRGWDKLIVQTSSGQIIRALSPNQGEVQNPSLFAGYYEPYVDAVWNKYSTATLDVDTQASFGVVQGMVMNGVLNFPGVGSYTKPSTQDIFTCSTGPFLTSTAGLAALTPRISAAFNRSTLLSQTMEPALASTYYQYPISNHYSRIVHANNIDKRGYAFPYDDVAPSGGMDQSGSVFDPNPSLLAVTIGGPISARQVNTQIKAASFDAQNGIITQPTSDTDSGLNCAYIANGDWVGFMNVDFGIGSLIFTARVASGAGTGISGLVQLVIDDFSSTPISDFAIANTGGWQSWKTIYSPFAHAVSGTHAVWIRFASGQPADFVNINWFEVSGGSTVDAAAATAIATIAAVADVKGVKAVAPGPRPEAKTMRTVVPEILVLDPAQITQPQPQPQVQAPLSITKPDQVHTTTTSTTPAIIVPVQTQTQTQIQARGADPKKGQTFFKLLFPCFSSESGSHREKTRDREVR